MKVFILTVESFWAGSCHWDRDPFHPSHPSSADRRRVQYRRRYHHSGCLCRDLNQEVIDKFSNFSRQHK